MFSDHREGERSCPLSYTRQDSGLGLSAVARQLQEFPPAAPRDSVKHLYVSILQMRRLRLPSHFSGVTELWSCCISPTRSHGIFLRKENKTKWNSKEKKKAS